MYKAEQPIWHIFSQLNEQNKVVEIHYVFYAHIRGRIKSHVKVKNHQVPSYCGENQASRVIAQVHQVKGHTEF